MRQYYTIVVFNSIIVLWEYECATYSSRVIITFDTMLLVCYYKLSYTIWLYYSVKSVLFYDLTTVKPAIAVTCL